MRRDRGKPNRAEPGAELLAAYADGIAELSPDERHRIEAHLAADPAARAEHAGVRGLLDQLRALPPEGAEPDWAAMERSIRAAVGPDAPRPWWRSWRWIAPATTLMAGLAVLLLVMWPRTAPVSEPATPPGHALTRPHELDRAPPVAEDVVALWLDGHEVEVDLSASDMLGESSLDEESGEGDANAGLLPATDLAWVDGLDADALSRAERWLAAAGKKG
jgi:anti-sigma factor RsiW